jgi:hypothetical protein
MWQADIIFFLILFCSHFILKMMNNGQAPVPHTYNLSHSGGRGQENHGLQPVQANRLQDPTSKKHITKKGLVEWLKL